MNSFYINYNYINGDYEHIYKYEVLYRYVRRWGMQILAYCIEMYHQLV